MNSVSFILSARKIIYLLIFYILQDVLLHLFLFLQKIQTDIPERKAAHRLCVWEVFSSPAYYNPLRS